MHTISKEDLITQLVQLGIDQHSDPRYLRENVTTLVEAQGYEFGLLSRIEALTQELVDAKQAARYETDVAQQAIADFEEAKGKIEALEKDAARLDFIGYHGLLCLDSVSNKAGGNGQKQVAATRCNIDAAIAGEAT